MREVMVSRVECAVWREHSTHILNREDGEQGAKDKILKLPND